MKSHVKSSTILVGLLLTTFLSGCTDEKKEPAKQQKATTSLAGIAAVSSEVAKSSHIEVETVGPVQIEETMTFYGSVRPNGEREQSVRARYPGTVISVRKSAGDVVKRGETLITVESSESLQTYAIVSPISGTVLERKANPGETVGSDAVLITIADLSTVWIDLAVFARDLGAIRPGLPVRITTADGRVSAQTKLSFVAPAGDAENQSVVARAVVDNSGERKWIAGQFVTGEIVLNASPAPLAVRASAIQTLNGKSTVFVEVPQGFEARAVQTGRTSAQSVEIRSGIRAGERYAATNSYLLKAELSKGEAEE
jgi:cobalt-zinc-cadmium efflux system membrane fusion protein